MVSLSLSGRRCVIVGGGEVALRRARELLATGARVAVIAPQIEHELYVLPVETIERAFQPGDLAGAFLVVTATDRRAVNEAVAAEAKSIGVLVNRADDGDEGDIRFPAATRIGPITLAVDTGCGLPAAAVRIRDEAAGAIDVSWSILLDLAARTRATIRDTITDRALRRSLIRRLVDDEAIALFRSRGPAAYRAHCKAILDSAFAPAPGRP